MIDTLEKGLGRITLLKSCHLTQVRWQEMKGDEVRNGMNKSDASGKHEVFCIGKQGGKTSGMDKD